MTRYDIQLYADNGDRIHGRRIECDRRDVPDNLIDIAADYLDNSPYPGAIQAQVNSGRYYTLFLVLLKNDTLNVYRHVRNADRAETREHPPGSAPPRDKEEA